MSASALRHGRVIASFGRHQEVEDSDGMRFDCSRRGRKQDVVCGDEVDFVATGGGTGVIEHIKPRHTLLYRSDAFKQKALASNIELALLVIAPVPAPREILFNRCLIAAVAAGMTPILICNKADLPAFSALTTHYDYYAQLGFETLSISALNTIDLIQKRVAHHDAIVMGESGMGKSTLINALLPEASLKTGRALEAGELGKHTTTHARRLALPEGGSITDTPGMQVFGLQHLSQHDLESAHPEFREAMGQCRFNDCRHDQEPGCAFKAQAEQNPRMAQRLLWMLEILRENERIADWQRGESQF